MSGRHDRALVSIAVESDQRRTRGEATRARLMAAGRSVFARRGYRATRVGDIVAEAGTSQGTFYLYFSSKDDLFAQLRAEVDAEFDRLATEVPRLGREPERIRGLESWIEQFLAACDRHRAVLRASTEADATHGRDTVAAHLGALGRALAAGSGLPEHPSFDPAPFDPATFDPVVASLALIATLDRLDLMAGDGRLDVTDRDLARTAAAILTDGLYGPDPLGAPAGAAERERAART